MPQASAEEQGKLEAQANSDQRQPFNPQHAEFLVLVELCVFIDR